MDTLSPQWAKNTPLFESETRGKKQSKKIRATRLQRGKFKGDVHFFVHKFVIYLNNSYICTNFNNTRYGSIISQ